MKISKEGVIELMRLKIEHLYIQTYKKVGVMVAAGVGVWLFGMLLEQAQIDESMYKSLSLLHTLLSWATFGLVLLGSVMVLFYQYNIFLQKKEMNAVVNQKNEGP